MKTLINNVDFADHVIRELQKIESKLKNGQIIYAYRDIRRLASVFEKLKADLLHNVDDSIENNEETT